MKALISGYALQFLSFFIDLFKLTRNARSNYRLARINFTLLLWEVTPVDRKMSARYWHLSSQHSRKYGLEWASYKVAWFSEHFKLHRLKCIYSIFIEISRASRNLSRGFLTNNIFYCVHSSNFWKRNSRIPGQITVPWMNIYFVILRNGYRLKDQISWIIQFFQVISLDQIRFNRYLNN